MKDSKPVIHDILCIIDDELQQERLTEDQITSDAGDLSDIMRSLGETSDTEVRMAGRPVRRILGNAVARVLERLELTSYDNDTEVVAQP